MVFVYANVSVLSFPSPCLSPYLLTLYSLPLQAPYRAVKGEAGGFLLKHCVGNAPKHSEVRNQSINRVFLSFVLSDNVRLCFDAYSLCWS
jgi:hypothetical protein